MPLRLLVFGRTGQVGSALAAMNGPDLQVDAVDRARADLCDPETCTRVVQETSADVVVNAAAFTTVDAAETDDATAMAVNARAPGAIAEAARRRGLPIIHLSTDYVFPGNGKTPWRETDLAAPINVYGATKRLGEQAVMGAHGGAVILRTSWVFSASGTNFVRTMLRVAEERDSLKVVNDQIGCPTAAGDIADAIVWIARSLTVQAGVPGIFHFCGAPSVTWHGFAQAIFARSQAVNPTLVPIRTAEWPAPAQRPRYSVLDCSLIRRAYGIRQPDWRRALGDVVADLSTEAA